jgi:imidazole glycerol-phosphate synthase subunit HisF
MAFLRKTKEPLMYYNARLETIQLARNLRHSTTKSEKILWRYINKGRILGYKFRRQHPIGFYVADFYCHKLRLVIEVDGPIHMLKDNQEHDVNRTAVLEQYDIEVIRFKNEDVEKRIVWVVESIRDKVRSKIPPSPSRGGPGRGH